MGAVLVPIRVTQNSPDRGKEAFGCFERAFLNGHRAAQDLDYIPLPPAVVQEIRRQLHPQFKGAL
ncbi:hypothetical protein PPMP20_38850 [Paraburkholderia phymatum]|uniref:hypothetical protein n=1 Tax=Paraburkholderia phymatum TaxID=148447 RepID=UPI0000E75CE2|nr:hypothetical protein [Paraburkholderia phymatum]